MDFSVAVGAQQNALFNLFPDRFEPAVRKRAHIQLEIFPGRIAMVEDERRQVFAVAGQPGESDFRQLKLLSILSIIRESIS
jgi:hypothetical protein